MKRIEIHIVLVISIFLMINACENKTTGNEDPGSVIEDYFKLIIQENYESAAKMFRQGEKELTEDEYRKVIKLIEWAVDQYETKGGIKEVVVVEETKIGDNKTAYVKYNIVFNNGDESDLKQDLIKADGKWYLKIASFL